MAKAKAVTVAKVKRKFWLPIVAPAVFNRIMLGETYVADPASTIGRIVHTNLKEITHNLKDQSAYVKFKIVSHSGNTLNTEINGFYLTPPSVKKLSKRSTLRLDDSFVVVSKDGKKLRVKTTSITLTHVSRSIGTAVMVAIRNFIANEASKFTFPEFVEKLMTRQLQSTVKKAASKVYPLKIFEVKNLEFAKSGKAVDAKPIEEHAVVEKKKETKQKQKTLTEEMQDELMQIPEEQKQAEQQQQAEEQPAQQDTSDFGEHQQ